MTQIKRVYSLAQTPRKYEFCIRIFTVSCSNWHQLNTFRSQLHIDRSAKLVEWSCCHHYRNSISSVGISLLEKSYWNYNNFANLYLRIGITTNSYCLVIASYRSMTIPSCFETSVSSPFIVLKLCDDVDYAA